MKGRWHAGDDRDVVGVGEGRHRRVAGAVETAIAKTRDRRQHSGRNARFEVARVASIGADHRRRPGWAAIEATVNSDLFHSARLRCRIEFTIIKVNGDAGVKIATDITLDWRRWADLSAPLLYALLQFRQAIFVVEQASPYADLDGRDARA